MTDQLQALLQLGAATSRFPQNSRYYTTSTSTLTRTARRAGMSARAPVTRTAAGDVTTAEWGRDARRSRPSAGILIEPMFRSLHGEPRFTALLRKLGLPTG